MNATEIRALSAEILLALFEDFHGEFLDEAMGEIRTVGSAIHHLMEFNRPQSTRVGSARSAKMTG